MTQFALIEVFKKKYFNLTYEAFSGIKKSTTREKLDKMVRYTKVRTINALIE